MLHYARLPLLGENIIKEIINCLTHHKEQFSKWSCNISRNRFKTSKQSAVTW